MEEADLAAAVIARALQDGCRSRSGKAPPLQDKAQEEDRQEAWLFLTAPSGEWEEARATWCGICGLDPDVLREEALNRGPLPGAVIPSWTPAGAAQVAA